MESSEPAQYRLETSTTDSALREASIVFEGPDLTPVSLRLVFDDGEWVEITALPEPPATVAALRDPSPAKMAVTTAPRFTDRQIAERELEQVFCLETERSISNDWVVRYENRYFQLERTSDYPPRQAKVTVCEWEDGRIEIRYKSKARPHREIEPPQPPPAAIRSVDKPPKPSHWKPPVGHPWKKPGPVLAAMMRAPASASP